MAKLRQKPDPDLILTADWHLREDTPACRVDDFQAAQWRKVEVIREAASRYGCPVVVAGDLFDSWRCSHELVNRLLNTLPRRLWTVPGQHELPYHRITGLNQSPLATLARARVGVEVMTGGTPFGMTEIPTGGYGYGEALRDGPLPEVLVWHRMVWAGRPPYPGAPAGGEAGRVLDVLAGRGVRLLVTGDNHQPFTLCRGGVRLVNCGCLTRQTVDEANHQPGYWLWWRKTNETQYVLLPGLDPAAVSAEHISARQEAAGRLDTFVELISGAKMGLDYRRNLTAALTGEAGRALTDGARRMVREAAEQ